MKFNTVRRTAIQFILGLRSQGYTNELPLQDAKQLFSLITDKWDRMTLKAYFGTVAHRSKRVINQRSQYASGTVSFKTIELTQNTVSNPGYLERMGLVSYNLKGSVWFMKVENSVLVPQLMKVDGSINNFSLSHTIHDLGVERSEENHSELRPILGVENGCLKTLQTNNNLQSERDKFYAIRHKGGGGG